MRVKISLAVIEIELSVIAVYSSGNI